MTRIPRMGKKDKAAESPFCPHPRNPSNPRVKKSSSLPASMKPANSEGMKGKDGDSIFSSIFSLLVFSSSLARRGFGGKSALSDHLPYRKRRERRLSSLECKTLPEAGINERPYKSSSSQKLPEVPL